MTSPITIKPVEKYIVIVVEFCTPSLMEPIALETISAAFNRLVDVEGHRAIILDLKTVRSVSGLGMKTLIDLGKKLTKMPQGSIVLCNLDPSILEVIKTTRLDRLFKVKPSQEEALKVVIP